MQVSIININFSGYTAIGQCIINQFDALQAQGDTVEIYTLAEPEGVPSHILPHVHKATLAQLISNWNHHFADSDLYIFHYPGYYLLLEGMKGIDHGLVIFNFHNVTPPDLWGTEVGRENLSRDLAVLPELLPYADFILADSPFNADQLVNQFQASPDRLRVLPLAVSLAQFKPQAKSPTLLAQYQLAEKPVILFVGRLAGNKRVDLLIEALALVRQAVPEATLLLVGGDQGNPALQAMKRDLEAQLAAQNLREAVIFAGEVADLAAHYHLADVYATASLHEGFGVPLIEAMAAGVPVVASDATAHPWVLGEAGLLVEPGNAADLAEKVIRVLTDSGVADQLREQGLKRAQTFSLEAYQQNLQQIVAEVQTTLPSVTYFRPNALLSQRVTAAELDRPEASPTIREVLLMGKLGPLVLLADIVDRQYKLASGVPVVGKLIVWLRHNLTSHLWQPYLNPALERQATFNDRVIKLLRHLIEYLFGYATQADLRLQQQQAAQAETAAQVARLEQWLTLVSDQIQVWDATTLPPEQREQVAALQHQIDQLRQEAALQRKL